MFGGGIDTAEDELMAQALGADIGDEDDESGDETAADKFDAPRDGEAYLRSVMREAKKEKQVVVAPNATSLTALRPRDHVYTGRQVLTTCSRIHVEVYVRWQRLNSFHLNFF